MDNDEFSALWLISEEFLFHFETFFKVLVGFGILLLKNTNFAKLFKTVCALQASLAYTLIIASKGLSNQSETFSQLGMTFVKQTKAEGTVSNSPMSWAKFL